MERKGEIGKKSYFDLLTFSPLSRNFDFWEKGRRVKGDERE
jgi:hypothetical protein